MANAKEIITFIAENRKRLNINIQSFSWPQKYGFSLKDVELSFKMDDQSYIGRGSAETETLAIIKAFSEAVERNVVYCNNLNSSNGIAVHDSIENASLNAACELIERDLFFCHYLTNTKFGQYRLHTTSDLIENTIDLCNRFNVNFSILDMGYKDEGQGICSILDGRNCTLNQFGLIVGTSYCKVAINAIEKAIIECLRDFTFILEKGNKQPIFDSKTVLYTPQDHLKFARTIEYGSYFVDNFVGGDNSRSIDITENSIKINELAIPAIFNSLSLKAVEACSLDLQGLFWGKVEEKKINGKRLSQFKDSKVKFKDLNRVPHPFG